MVLRNGIVVFCKEMLVDHMQSICGAERCAWDGHVKGSLGDLGVVDCIIYDKT